MQQQSAPKIARAGIDDLDALGELFEAYRVFYRQPADPAVSRAFIEARLQAGDSVIFLARPAAGFIQLYSLFSSTARVPGRLWVLNDLFVAPNDRSRGVGRSLMLRAEAFARETGSVGLELSTATDNHTAQRLYEACGYVRDDEFLVYHRRFSPDSGW